jgi:uncharacterized protein
MPPLNHADVQHSSGAVAAREEGAAPRPAARIEALDVLRGVAICGILLMNIFSMGGVGHYPLTTFPARWNAEWVSWGLQTLFVQGAMRGLFTLLFGASMLLMLRRSEGARGEVGPIDAWARRSIALMGFGLVQWLLFVWPGEILWNYGLTALFLLAFRSARPRSWLIAAAVLMTALTANMAYRTWQEVGQLQQSYPALALERAGQPVSADARDAIAAERTYLADVHPSAADRADEIARRSHPRSLFKWSERFWDGENLGLTAWLDVAESMSFMLIGMALLRAGVLTGEASAATYRWMMIGGYGVGLALRGWLVWLAARTGWDMGLPIVSAATWTVALSSFQPARLLVTLGHVGLVMSVWRAGWLGRGTTLRALGRMTLTVYCLQSILGSVLFYGFGLVGAFGLPALWGIAAGIWVVTAVFCRLWLARFAMGPAERLIRSIAYGEFGWARRRQAGSTAAGMIG